MYSPAHALTEVDLFVEVPLDFDHAYQEAVRAEVAPGIEGPFIGLEDLVRLKRKAETMWEAGWEGHERQQLRRLSRQPLADKLRWLERAHRLVRQLQGRPRLISRRRGISPGR